MSEKLSTELAYQIRRHALDMTARANSSHIGGCLSCADILAVLYSDILKLKPEKPEWTRRDRLVMSKGHCCAALYAALALRGFFDEQELATYGLNDSRLLTHASHHVPGVEWSTGALGHGLGLACGQALAGKRRNASWKVFALCSDGEMDEGSFWEAVLFAGHHQLNRLHLIIDANGMQALGKTDDVLNTEPLAGKFKAFHWSVREVDGHDHEGLHKALKRRPSARPLCTIARTVKGKGVDFMEHALEWHYRATVDPEQHRAAEASLERMRLGDGGAV